MRLFPRENDGAQAILVEVRQQQYLNEPLAERNVRKQMTLLSSRDGETLHTRLSRAIQRQSVNTSGGYTLCSDARGHQRDIDKYLTRYCCRYFSQLRMEMCRTKEHGDVMSKANPIGAFHPPGGAKRYLATVSK